MRTLIAATAVLVWLLGSVFVQLYTDNQLITRSLPVIPLLFVLLSTQIGGKFSPASAVLVFLYCSLLLIFSLSHAFWLLVPLGVLAVALWWTEQRRGETRAESGTPPKP
jgi:hypothetical protein